MKVLTTQQMRQVEEATAQRGTSLDQLMENAGLAVARIAWENLQSLRAPLVLALVGPGNNGGDGLVAARHLQAWGAHVVVCLCASRSQEDPKLGLALKEGAQALDVSTDAGLEHYLRLLPTATLVIDAVLGTGRARPITDVMAGLFKETAAANKVREDLQVLAVDLPSGLRADTGEVDPACIPADITVSLGFPKPGLFLFPGARYVGRLRVVDIGTSPAVLDEVEAPELLQAEWVRSVLPARPLSAHKGTFGRVLAVAGSQNYLGAAYLACMGAARTGAGYVTLAAPFRLQAILATKLTEATYLTLPESTPGALSPETARVLRQALPGYNVLLIGPGIGQHPSTVAIVRSTLLGEPPLVTPVVADADALNILAQTPGWWEQLKAPAVLTPHPGEMARLLDRSIESIEQSRWDRAMESAQKWDVSLVLKGAFSVVASPQGGLRVSPFANPALATAGTGDVLAGVIAGLVAQGLSPFDAAAAGVYLHGAAGELMRQEIGDAGAVASDLLPLLPRILRLVRQGKWKDTL